MVHICNLPNAIPSSIVPIPIPNLAADSNSKSGYIHMYTCIHAETLVDALQLKLPNVEMHRIHVIFESTYIHVRRYAAESVIDSS